MQSYAETYSMRLQVPETTSTSEIVQTTRPAVLTTTPIGRT